MREHVFTIFEGPDKGKRFVLKETPIGIGRDAARDVVLRDERASRFHATLAFDGENVVIVDQNSSNGTFVNGELVERSVLKEGDVITIASTRIIFAPEAPEKYRTARGFETRPAHSKDTAKIRSTRLVASYSGPTLEKEHTRPVDVLEAVVDAAMPLAEPLGICLAVEAAPEDRHHVIVNRQSLYRNLAELVEMILKLTPKCDGTLALRLSYDELVGVSQIEILGVGLPVPRDRIQALSAKGAFGGIWRALHAEGCTLMLLPVDSRDILARIYLPESPDRPNVTQIQ